MVKHDKIFKLNISIPSKNITVITQKLPRHHRTHISHREAKKAQVHRTKATSHNTRHSHHNTFTAPKFGARHASFAALTSLITRRGNFHPPDDYYGPIRHYDGHYRISARIYKGEGDGKWSALPCRMSSQAHGRRVGEGRMYGFRMARERDGMLDRSSERLWMKMCMRE